MVSIATMLLNVVLNLALVRAIGFRGLALGTALASIVNAVLLLWLLRRRIGGIDGRRLAVAVAKISVASAVMAGSACGSRTAEHHHRRDVRAATAAAPGARDRRGGGRAGSRCEGAQDPEFDEALRMVAGGWHGAGGRRREAHRPPPTC